MTKITYTNNLYTGFNFFPAQADFVSACKRGKHYNFFMFIDGKLFK